MDYLGIKIFPYTLEENVGVFGSFDLMASVDLQWNWLKIVTPWVLPSLGRSLGGSTRVAYSFIILSKAHVHAVEVFPAAQ